ncbi:deoxyribodipyrimidine photo-lyase [Proteiniclasticum sp. C24MP]|uniref:deoxyribodipyrimidine photo-lyase n=1 Tax=Proteiniclasticum sp. C24MP TaxID=3374101 RepID=UPI00375501DA
MIPQGRIQKLNTLDPREGDYILYWMQASQRISCNHALAFAMDEAARLHLPLVVYFGLTASYPESYERHYHFMVEGLLEVKKALTDMDIQFIVLNETPSTGAVKLSERAALLVTDRGYLKIQRQWRAEAAEAVSCPMLQVESDVLVPADETSMKEEYSAATIRRKIERLILEYAPPLERREMKKSSLSMKLPLSSIPFENAEDILSALSVNGEVAPVSHLYKGGYAEARRRLDDFVENRLEYYAEKRNEPSEDLGSDLSPYLHFGQISPLEIYLALSDHHSESKRVFLDELIVRRELAVNFVLRNPHYDSFASITSFAKDTLLAHSKDERPYLYSTEELEQGKTHDPYWNAAQLEMVHLGKMQGYMRMYWGKKIIEWTETPEKAYETALYLNNKYNLDGRDPNGFAGVAWCFGKHDRGWKERPVFGKVRYMNANGLERKFDIRAYVENVEAKIRRSRDDHA